MKLKNYMAMMAAVLCLAACSDDEETVKPSEAVAGNYQGTITMSVASTSYDPTEATIQITAVSDNTVTIVLPSAGSGAMALPSLTVSGAVVSTTDDVTYTISETAINQDKYVGSLTGTIKNGKADIDYSVTPGAMPMAINFDFTGEKK